MGLISRVSSRTYRNTHHLFQELNMFQARPDYSAFLKEEIRLERESQVGVSFKDMEALGFKVELNGSECVLEKDAGDQKIAVSFNVNGSVAPMDPESEEDQEPISYPDFHVAIEKNGHPKVAEFDCFFPDENPEEFEIRSICVVAKEEKDQKTAPYFVNTENVDPNMYENTKGYLLQHGINADFSDKLIDLATSVETDAYISTLEDLQQFV